MPPLVRTIVLGHRRHITLLGILGNAAFFVGSILFLDRFSAFDQIGVWLFIGGSFLMLVGSVGQALARRIERHGGG